MRMHHAVRHAFSAAKNSKSEAERLEEETSQHIHAGLNMRDGICIALAIFILGAIALYIEHLFHVNGDILFDGGVAVGAHPLHIFIRRVSYMIFEEVV